MIQQREYPSVADGAPVCHVIPFGFYWSMLSMGGRLLVAGVLVASTASLRAGAQQVSLSGVVQDATSAAPLVGAIVVLGPAANERTTRTDANGVFSFANVTKGTHPLAVRRLGYEPSRSDVEVPPSQPIVVALKRATSLDTVRVRAANQGIYGAVGTARDLRPLNASVQVIGASVGRLRTDSTGHFFAPVKTPGPYLVRATAGGFTSQTVSVTVQANEGVEVALLLDSATGPGAAGLEMAFADFADRMMQRGLASALVPRTDLTRYGEGTLVSSIVSAGAFEQRALRFGSTACVFVDGRPIPGMSLNAYRPQEVEMVEVYGANGDRTRNLSQRWPRSGPCGDTGRPPVSRGDDVVMWVVIWLKH